MNARILLYPLLKALRPVGLLFRYVAVRSAPRRRMFGFWAYCSDVAPDCSIFFSHCNAALELISTHDPRRFSRMRRDVRAVALTSRGASFYDSWLRVIFIDRDVLKRKPEYLASTLVHEAAHARFFRSGVRSYTRNPGRHERACVAQEIEFVQRLPNSHMLLEELKQALHRPWWNESGRETEIKRFARRHNLPGWLEQVLFRLGAR